MSWEEAVDYSGVKWNAISRYGGLFGASVTEFHLEEGHVIFGTDTDTQSEILWY